MSFQIETILTDDSGNRIVLTTHYADVHLTNQTLDNIESLVLQAKHDIGKQMEHEILLLNQKAHTKKKKASGHQLNGKNEVKIQTMNGCYFFANQRYISKDRKTPSSYLQSCFSEIGQVSGYQSNGLLEFMSSYCCELSYEKVSELLQRLSGEHRYTGCEIQHKIVAIAPLVSQVLVGSPPLNGQLSLNFVTPMDKMALYAAESQEIHYFDDGVGVIQQKEKRSDSTYEKTKKYVQTDVVVLANADQSYHYFSANEGMYPAMDLETQISCHLSTQYKSIPGDLPFVAITDGARCIRLRIERLVGTNACIILDWYHLQHKIWQYMSRLGQGKIKKEIHAKALLHDLWNGRLTDALIYSDEAIQVPPHRMPILEELQAYLLKHHAEIIDYNTRWRMGKPIGSGRGEKANHQIIAKRQKNNGTSWSNKGSHAIASLNCLKLNNQWKSFWSNAA